MKLPIINTPNSSTKIESSVMKIGVELPFTLTGAQIDAMSGDVANDCGSRILAGVRARYENAKVSIKAVTRFGQKAILMNVKLFDLLEFSAGNFGMMSIKQLNGHDLIRMISNDTAGQSGDFALYGTIEVSNYGSLELRNGDHYTIDVTGMPVGTSLQLYAIDSFKRSNIFNVFETINFNAYETKSLDVSKVKKIGIPMVRNMAGVQFELKQKNGHSVRYDDACTKTFAEEQNEAVANFAGLLISGYADIFVMEITEVEELTFQFPFSGELILLTEKINN